MPVDRSVVPALRNIATRLRIESARATSEAGSGHPSSCCSAAEIMAAHFFGQMRFDPKNPRDPANDRFVMSKGHAAPILYAAWAEAGLVNKRELSHLRRLDSDLEGHPTPRLSFVDVATGSLGQGICAAVGIALNARLIGSDYRTYVLLGDGESAEGSVWEAAQAAAYYKLDSLCVTVDINAFGQSRPTPFGHDADAFARRWRAFEWHAIIVDGHDIAALLEALDEARTVTGCPTVILARTLKGKGISRMEGKPGWHGKALKKGAELDSAIAELEGQLVQAEQRLAIPRPSKPSRPRATAAPAPLPAPTYPPETKVATREAYGHALAALGAVDERVVGLDADVGNSTFSEFFEQKFPDRFFQAFIAEQAMVGMAMGLASQGAIPFPSTFACFLSRAYDFIRMAGISGLDIKLAGSHAGVSIGEDGPSQMGLEDLAMMRAVPNCAVLYPCDAVSAYRLVETAAYHRGPAYIRTSRPKTEVIYPATEQFPIGGSKVIQESERDVLTIVAAGVTVFEALEAYGELQQRGVAVRIIDAYSVQPIDEETLRRCGRETNDTILTVEDHYVAGGLGDAVGAAVAPHGIAVHRLAVREVPRSGQPGELLDRFGISSRHIVETVQKLQSRTGEQ